MNTKFLVLLLVSLITVSSPFNLKNDKKNNKSIVIYIDIGHSKKTVGAISSRGVGEYHFNLRLSKTLIKFLKEAGFENSFLLSDENENLTLKERIQRLKSKKADILLSIHHDSVQPKYLKKWKFENRLLNYSDNFRGYSVFVSSLNNEYKKSLLLAKNIAKELKSNNLHPTFHHTENIPGENKKILDSNGVFLYDNLRLLKSSNIPSVLVECGVIVNRDEEILLNQEWYIEKICKSIINGIKNYLNIENH